ncbi:MAG: MerR family transcriptional regulator [Betaproteobacteria bacterium]|nr:MAG: MerR family transcriptional regulator [Betaproteobacteria bacterium]
MQIRDVSAHVGLSTETIRYFEREGLIDPPNRNTNGYRRYTRSQIERLRFIANCRSLEMSHDEIRQLLDAEKSPDTECETVAGVVRHHVVHVETRISLLQELLKVLKSVEASCAHDGAMRACDVMKALSTPIHLSDAGQKTHL